MLLGQLVLWPGSASATTINVTSTADVATNFGACGTSSQTTPTGTSLREAICAANNAGAASTTIDVAAGTFHITNGELQMGLVAGSNIILNGAGAGSTIIDAGGTSRVLDLDPNLVGGVSTSISGVTISGGTVTTFGGAGIIAGSGHATTKDTLSVANSTVSGNTVNSATSNKPGGGIQFEGGSLTITNSTISGNNSGSSSGSGVHYIAEGSAAGEQLTVTGSTFSGNTANATVANINIGGALSTGASGVVTFTVSNDRFTGNTVLGSGTGIPEGAGVLSQNGTMNLTGSTFTNDSVSGGQNPAGGAIAILGGTATAHYNRITGNVSPTAQGAYLSGGASLDASENWWGCNTGPGTAGCDSVAGAPTVTPRLVVTATASPAHVIGPNGTSTLTASLLTDSAGGAVSAANLNSAFSGLPVSFSDPPGDATVTLSPGAHSVNLANGTANIDYHSNTTLGPDNDMVTLDNGTVTDVLEVDEPPMITSANTAHFQTDQAGSFTITTLGYPSAAITEVGSLPSGLTFHDNGDGSATISGTPGAATGGNYPLTLTANNGYAPNATQTLTVNVAQPPAFTSASTATFVIGQAGSFAVTTSGVPTVSTITESGTLPTGVTFTDNGNGTATIAGTPTGTGNTYPVTLTASNGVSPNATQNLTIQVNQAPQVTLNPSDVPQAHPGDTVSFTAAASGVPTPTVQWQRSTDGGASFVNIAGATSTTYSFTAALSDDGNQYRAVFSNGVGSPATTTAATLNVGTAPAFTSADHTSFVVGQAGSFSITTTGAPSATLSRTGAQFPAWLTLTDNGDGTGTLTGTPPAGSAGQYQFALKAANGFAPSASQVFTLFVDDSPVITSANHTTFTAGQAGSFAVTTAAGFPTTTAISESGSLPSGVTFHDNGDGTATLAGTPAAGTGGTYPITITATATGGLAASATQSFTLTVLAPPVITSANHATFSAGTPGSFTVTTSAGNPAATTLAKTGTLPAGVSFTDNGDGTATLAGTPSLGSGGVYTITITASNGVAPDATQSFTLTVNEPPHITSANHATFTANAANSFTVSTAGGQPAAITLTETGSLPAGVTFTDNGDGTATLGGTPSTGGTFPITITASNGVLPNATQAFTLTVNATPVITSADHTTFAVGSAGSFTVTTNPGVPAATTITKTGALPAGVSFTDNGDGTATLAGTPAAGTGGTYSVTFTATNTVGHSDQAFTLTVAELPVITSANHTTFAVGSAGTFTVTTRAGFPAATTLTELGSLPSGVSFTDNGDGTATMAGTPAAGTGGSYPLTVTATNSAGHTDQAFTLTVTDAPVITSADHATFAVGAASTFTVTTTAGTPATTTLTESGALPSGVMFHDNGDGTATLSGTAAAGGGGSYALTITASNGALPNSTQAFTLTVTELPLITSANHSTLQVGAAGTFTVTATVGYPTATTLTEGGALPSGLTFTDNGNGTATLAGTPAAGTGGSYPLTFTATNSAGHTSQAFTLTVGDSPTITSADHATATVNIAGSFTVTTAGGYPTPPALSQTGALPNGVTFHDNGNGTATLAGTPTVGGSFTIAISADNGVAPATTQSFTLTVNGPPVFTSPNTVTFLTGNNCASYLITTTSAGSPGSTQITLTGTLPSGVTFRDNGNGTATLSGCVNGISSTQTFPVTLTATNSVGPTTQSLTVRVQPPSAIPLPNQLPASNGTLQGVPANTTLGQILHVSGGGYAPGAPISLGYYSGRVTLLTNVFADVHGNFTATIQIVAVGSHTYVAAGTGANGRPRYLESATNTSSVVAVAPASGAAGPQATSNGVLPLTGPKADVRATTALGLVAILAGWMLLVATRRRHIKRKS